MHIHIFTAVSDNNENSRHENPEIKEEINHNENSFKKLQSSSISRSRKGKKVQVYKNKMKDVNDMISRKKTTKRSTTEDCVKPHFIKKSKTVQKPNTQSVTIQNGDPTIKQKKDNNKKCMNFAVENCAYDENNEKTNGTSEAKKNVYKKTTVENKHAKIMPTKELMEKTKKKIKKFTAPTISKVDKSMLATWVTSVSQISNNPSRPNGPINVNGKDSRDDISNDTELNIDVDDTVDTFSSQKSTASSLDFEM